MGWRDVYDAECDPFPPFDASAPGEQDWLSDEDVYEELRRLFHAREGGDAVGCSGAADSDDGGD